jgi:SAM-dependent methyltransferase
MRVLKEINDEAYSAVAKNTYAGTKYSVEKSRLNIVLSILRRYQTDSLLDVGCGEGIYIRKMQPYYKLLIGLDFCKAALLDIKKEMKDIKNVEFILADAQKLPMQKHSIDFVLSSELLEHTENPIEVIKQIDDASAEYVLLTVPIETSENFNATVDLTCPDQDVLKHQLKRNLEKTSTTHVYKFSYHFMEGILKKIPDLEVLDERSSAIAFFGSGSMRRIVSRWKPLEQLWKFVETELLSRVLIFRADYHTIGSEFCVFVLKRRNYGGRKER